MGLSSSIAKKYYLWLCIETATGIKDINSCIIIILFLPIYLQFYFYLFICNIKNTIKLWLTAIHNSKYADHGISNYFKDKSSKKSNTKIYTFNVWAERCNLLNAYKPKKCVGSSSTYDAVTFVHNCKNKLRLVARYTLFIIDVGENVGGKSPIRDSTATSFIRIFGAS